MKLVGLVGLAVAVLLGCSEARAASPACTQFFDLTQPVPVGWAASYDVFSATHPPLAVVDCTQATTPITVGRANSNLQAVYQTVYVWDGTNWQPTNLTSTNPQISPGWIQRTATANLNLSSSSLQSEWVYVAFLVAQWTGTKWVFGCANTACVTPSWSLLAETVVPVTPTPPPPSGGAISISVNPTPPIDLVNTAAPGTIVALLTASWNNGNPFTGTISFVSPNFDAGGVYSLTKITASEFALVVNISGPGLPPPGTLTNVSVQASQ